MDDLNTFKHKKDLFYKTYPKGTEEEFYAQPDVRKYTKQYQDKIVMIGEDTFVQYEYKIEFHKENRYLIVSSDYQNPEDGFRILTQKYGGIENCYISFFGQRNLGGVRILVSWCEASRSYKPSFITTMQLRKILNFWVSTFVFVLIIYLIYKVFA